MLIWILCGCITFLTVILFNAIYFSDVSNEMFHMKHFLSFYSAGNKE